MDTLARHSPRAPLLWLLLPLMAGYGCGREWPDFSPAVLTLAGLACLMTAWLLLGKETTTARWLWSTAILTGATLLSWSYFILRYEKPPVGWLRLPPREATLTLRVERLFNSAGPSGLVRGLATVIETPGHLPELKSQKISFALAPAKNAPTPICSTVIRAKGILTYLEAKTQFNDFDRYLVRGGVFFEFRRGRILQTIDAGDAFHRFCARENERFEAIFQMGGEDHPDLAAVYVAMMLGEMSILSKEQQTAFIQSGTVHLFAISGMNIAVVAVFLSTLLDVLRFPRKPGALLTLTAIFLYVEVTGGAPSALRAWLMVGFFWGARIFLKQASAFSALLGAAMTLLLIQPLQLWDAGFQLSHAVVAAILLYVPLLTGGVEEKFALFRGLPTDSYRWTHRLALALWRNVTGLIIVSFAATLMSAPLVIYHFHNFAPGGLFINLLLVPLASLITVAGFISMLGGLLHLGWVSIFINHGVWVMVWLMEKIVALSLAVPGFFCQLRFHAGILGPLAALALLAAFLAAVDRSARRYGLAYWGPPLLLILALSFGTEIMSK